MSPTLQRCSTFFASLALLAYVSQTPERPDLANDPSPEAQAELRTVVDTILEDLRIGNIEGLQAAHLDSDKFTKFGPRSFDRQDVAAANASEAAFFGSVSNFDIEARDLEIDVFGDVGVVTYYPQASFVLDGEPRTSSGRQTFVFVKTSEGWKLAHEHGTPDFAATAARSLPPAGPLKQERPPVIDVHMHAPIGPAPVSDTIGRLREALTAMDEYNVRLAVLNRVPDALFAWHDEAGERVIPSLLFPCENGAAVNWGRP